MKLFQILKINGVKDVLFIAGGSVIAQGFTIVVMPILSRIYSPADFGIAAAFSSILSILLPLSSLRYFHAIALPRQQRYACAIANLAAIIQFCYFMFLLFVIAFIGDTLLSYMNMESVSNYKILIPFAVWGASLYEMLVQCAIRMKLFSIIAKTKVSQSLSGGVTKIVLGVFGLHPIGLIIGIIIGQAGGITSLIFSLSKKKFLQRSKRYLIKRAALKYRNFPLYAMPSAIVDTAGTQIIPLLVFSFYGTTTAGYFSMAQQLLLIPSVFIGNAIGQVFLQRASVAKYNGTLGKLCGDTYKTLLKVGILPMAILMLTAPFVFEFVFGKEWIKAGEYVKFLAPITMMNFAYSPISHIFNIQNRQKTALILQTIFFTVITCCFLIGAVYHSPYLSIGLYSIGGSLMIGIITFYVLRIAYL